MTKKTSPPAWTRLEAPTVNPGALKPPEFHVPWIRTTASPDYDRRMWKDASIEARIRHTSGLLISHSHFAAGVKAMTLRRELRRSAGKCLGMHFLARSNGGKTTFAQYALALMPPTFDREEPRRPLLAISVPNPCTRLEVFNAILKACGDPDYENKREAGLPARVYALMRALHVEILMIDNVQDIPLVRGERGLMQMSAFLRELFDETQTIPILLGTSDSEIVIDAYDQVKRRAPGRVNLAGYDVLDAEDLGRYLRMIQEFDKGLAMPRDSGLATNAKHTGRAIAFATDGEIGATNMLLVFAVRIATQAGHEIVTHEDCEAAYKALYLEYAEKVNPFSPDFRFNRRLNEAGEPHFVDSTAGRRRRRRGDAA